MPVVVVVSSLLVVEEAHAEVVATATRRASTVAVGSSVQMVLA